MRPSTKSNVLSFGLKLWKPGWSSLRADLVVAVLAVASSNFAVFVMRNY